METWNVVLWNDPVNPAPYVSYVLRRHLAVSPRDADRLTEEANANGRTVIDSGPREQIEFMCQLLHAHALSATLERRRGYPICASGRFFPGKSNTGNYEKIFETGFIFH